MAADDETLEAEYQDAPLAVREERASVAIMPAVTPAEAKAAMEQYQAVCEAVLTPDDYQTFKERGKEKRFKKKSAVKKLQTFWSVTVRVREMIRDDLGDGHFGFRCIATATMPSGREVEASGGCSTFEERFDIKPYDDESEQRFAERAKKARARSYHDVMSTAETRATNRAVMNCIGVGGGEVTADEISRRPEPAPPRAAAKGPETAQEPVVDLMAAQTLWIRKGRPEGTGKAFFAKAGGLAAGVAALEAMPDVGGQFGLDKVAFKGEPILIETGPKYDPERPSDAIPYEDPAAKERRRMRAIVADRGIDDNVRRAIMIRMFGKASSKDLTFAQLVQLNGELANWVAP
jgi:hypothetical protein